MYIKNFNPCMGSNVYKNRYTTLQQRSKTMNNRPIPGKVGTLLVNGGAMSIRL